MYKRNCTTDKEKLWILSKDRKFCVKIPHEQKKGNQLFSKVTAEEHPE